MEDIKIISKLELNADIATYTMDNIDIVDILKGNTRVVVVGDRLYVRDITDLSWVVFEIQESVQHTDDSYFVRNGISFRLISILYVHETLFLSATVFWLFFKSNCNLSSGLHLVHNALRSCWCILFTDEGGSTL